MLAEIPLKRANLLFYRRNISIYSIIFINFASEYVCKASAAYKARLGYQAADSWDGPDVGTDTEANI